MALSKSNIELLTRLRAEGEQALSEYFLEVRPSLKTIVSQQIMSQLKARLDASDVLQEAYLRARMDLKNYLSEPRLTPYAWLARICRQALMHTFRHNIGTKKRSLELEEMSFNEVEECSLAVNQVSPSSWVRRQEMGGLVEQAISQLGPQDQKIIGLVHDEFSNLREAAQLLGVSYEAAKKRYRRAMRRLGAILKATGAFND